MSEAFDWSRTTISVAAALGWLVNGVTQPLMGHLFDRYNSRRIILISLVVAGVSTAALSLTFHILFLIFLFSFVLSTAMSGASIGTLAPLLARWFQRRRTTVLGLVVAGSSLGGLILIPFSAYLVELTNWKTSWIVLGLIITALAVPLGFIFLKNRPSDLGLEPDGDPTTVNSSMQRRRGLFEVDEWWRSFGSRPIWHLSAAYTVCGVTVGMISIHFVPYAQQQVGVSATTAGLIFGYMMGLNVVGAIGGGFLADRFGRKNVLGAVYLVRGLAYVALLAGLVAVERNIVITLPMGWGDIAWLAWMGSPGLLSLWVFATLAGFSWIASVPVTTSLTADVYGLRALGRHIGNILPVSPGGGLRQHYVGGCPIRPDPIIPPALRHCRVLAVPGGAGCVHHQRAKIFRPLRSRRRGRRRFKKLSQKFLPLNPEPQEHLLAASGRLPGPGLSVDSG